MAQERDSQTIAADDFIPGDIFQLPTMVVSERPLDTFQDVWGSGNIFDYGMGTITAAPTDVTFGTGTMAPPSMTQPLQPMPVQGVYEQVYNDELARTNAARARQGLPPLTNLDAGEINRIADFSVSQVGKIYDDAQRDLDRAQAARQIGSTQMPLPIPLPIPGDLASVLNAAQLIDALGNVVRTSNLDVPTPATPQDVVSAGGDLSQIGTVPPSPSVAPSTSQTGSGVLGTIGQALGGLTGVAGGATGILSGGGAGMTGTTTQTTSSTTPVIVTPGATGGSTNTGSSTPSTLNPGGTRPAEATSTPPSTAVVPSAAEQAARAEQEQNQLAQIMNQGQQARAEIAAEEKARQQRELLIQIMNQSEAARRDAAKAAVVPTQDTVSDSTKEIIRTTPQGPTIKPGSGRIPDTPEPPVNPPVNPPIFVPPVTTTTTTTTSVNPSGVTPLVFNLPTSTYTPMPTTPAQRNIFTEGTTTSSAFTALTPALSQMYGGLARGYQSEDEARLYGMAAPGSQFARAQQGLTGMASAQTEAANRALRAANLQDVMSMQQQALQARKGANPELYGALQQLTGQAQQQAASDFGRMQTAGQLSPEDIRNAQQAAREAYAARGQVMSPGAVGAEILNRQALQQQREQQARQNYQQSFGNLGAATQMQTANIFDPFSTILGQQYGMQTQNVGTTQGLFGQAGALASGGLSYAPVVQTYNPFGVYPADVYGTNVNAVNAAQIAEANRAAALQAANLGQTGDYAKALGTFLGTPTGGNVLGGIAKLFGIGG